MALTQFSLVSRGDAIMAEFAAAGLPRLGRTAT